MEYHAIVIEDWIRPYSSGIWRVSRILRDFNEFRYSLDNPKVRSLRTLVFSNRLVNNAWKRAFSTECSELAWVTPVTEDDSGRITDLLKKDSHLFEAFEKYEVNPKPVDLIVNLRFGQLPNADIDLFKSTCEGLLAPSASDGLTLDDILERLRAAGYHDCISKMPTSAGLQMISANHELRGGDFALRRFIVRTS